MPEPYTYNATVVRVIDGDTVVLDVDLGFRTFRKGGSFRLSGINARELWMPGGKEAKANLEGLLPVGGAVQLTSVKPDKYGDRYDAIISLKEPDGWVDLAWFLVAEGWALPYDGQGALPIPAWPRVTK